MDCWTFFEVTLIFARMLGEPESNWTPEQLVRYTSQQDRRNALAQQGGEPLGAVS